MSVETIIEPTQELSGYYNNDTFLATRYIQGGRTTFNIDLSLDQLANTVSQPDPNLPTEGNRKIVPRHAQGFAKYLKIREDGVIPPPPAPCSRGSFHFHFDENSRWH